MSDQPKRRGALFWILVLVGAAVALFCGSAIVVGIMQANEREDVRQKATSLSSIHSLQNMILSGVKKNKRPPLACWYMGAIGFRLAEARDLKIPMMYAIDLANDQYLVEEFAKNGFNAKRVIAGMAIQVYESPLPPASTFDVQVEACDRGLP